MAYLILLLHILVSGCIGYSALFALGQRQTNVASLSISIALGMIIETLLTWLLHLAGLPILTSFVMISIIALGTCGYICIGKKGSSNWEETTFNARPSIWELAMLFFLMEKIVWSFYSLAHLPVYFDDALNHWAGRGKAMLSGTNWSWDPESVYFMGKAFGEETQPLFLSIWRAINASLLGGYNDGLERVDGFILWMIILIITIHWVTRLTGKRWVGLLAATIISGMPLQTWHGTAGYAEVYVQVYLLLAVWALFKKKYILAGLLSAGLIWSKNEGLVIFVPCLAVGLLITLLLDQSQTLKERITKFTKYNLSWLFLMLPWIIFKWSSGLGYNLSNTDEVGFVDGSLPKLYTAFFDSPSSSILWIFLLLGMILSAKRIWSRKNLHVLLLTCIALLVATIFLYTFTGSYIGLENQATIHRSLLQIAPLFIILVCAALGSSSSDNQSTATAI